MDITSQDVQNLLQSLNQHGVRYLLVGGMAGIFHGHVRTTQDLDLWLPNDEANRERFIESLKAVGVVGAAALRNVPFLFGWTTVSFGKTGFTLDLGHELKAFQSADFDVCYDRALEADIDGTRFRVLHLNDLITEKSTRPRPKDLGDLDELRRIQHEGNS
jgi:predicted nucleotidyltransferase